MDRLPCRASLSEYQRQAGALLNGWTVGAENATEFFWRHSLRQTREALAAQHGQVDIVRELLGITERANACSPDKH